jgi:hypothetical protein
LAGLVFAVGAHDRGVDGAGVGFEVLAGVALIADHDDMPDALDTGQQAERDVAFADLGARQRQRPGGPSRANKACSLKPKKYRL